MRLEISAVLETNGQGFLLYAENFPGAFVRGPSLEEAMGKWEAEMASYLRWRDGAVEGYPQCSVHIVQTKRSALDVQDADSDVLFGSERLPLTVETYQARKALALRSAGDFLALYESIPDKTRSALPVRKTFYGPVPRTAEEMYLHTKNVNPYYFGEIGVEVGNGPDILRCREEGFARLESLPGFLENRVFDGSYAEQWTTSKVLRRFLWHDRIHARAMVRMALGLWRRRDFADPFYFSLGTE